MKHDLFKACGGTVMAPPSSLETLLNQLKDLVCPITLDILEDPVELCCGHILSRKAAEKWLDANKDACPLRCEEKTPTTLLSPDKLKKQTINTIYDELERSLLELYGDNLPLAFLTAAEKVGMVFCQRLAEKHDINSVNSDEKSAILLAVEKNKLTPFYNLRASGATFDSYSADYRLLFNAIATGRMDFINEILYFYAGTEPHPNYSPAQLAFKQQQYETPCKPTFSYSRVPFAWINQTDNAGQTALEIASKAKDLKACTALLYFGAQTVFKQSDGTYHHISIMNETHDGKPKLPLNHDQIINWTAVRLLNYIHSKKSIITHYQRSGNLFLVIWSVILRIFFFRKIEAANKLKSYLAPDLGETKSLNWVRHYLPELKSGELYETAFKPFLQYSQQNGFLEILPEKTIEESWLRSESTPVN